MKKLEVDIKEYLKERAWDKLRPGDLAKSVSIEAAELLEIFQWDNPDLESVASDAERIAALRGELADVLIYCFDLAVILDIDVESMVREKLEKVKKKYPAEMFRNLGAGEQGTHEEYKKIKREYRQASEQ